MRRIQSTVGGVLAGAIAGYSPVSLAVEPMTIAAVASLGAKGLELFKSGANPGAVMTVQNHEMLRLLHERLGDFTNAFARVYEEIGEISKQIGEVVKHVRDDEERRNMLEFVEELEDEFELLADDQTPDYLSPDKYKVWLREYSRAMLGSENDLSLPYLLMGLRLEKALYFGFGHDKLWKKRELRYRKRIAKMLDPTREISLVASRLKLEEEIEQEKTVLEGKLILVPIEYSYTVRLIEPDYWDLWPNDLGMIMPWYIQTRQVIDSTGSRELIENVIRQQLINESLKLTAQLRLVDIYRVMESQAA